MVSRTRIAALAVAVLLAAAPARAGARWDTPSIELAVRGVHDSDLFPGSALSTPDRGLHLSGAVETGRRLSRTAKVSLGADADGQLWNRFPEASYARIGGNATLRQGGTQLRGDLEWTPRRLKFPAELDGGEFERLETRVGVRQALGPRARLRLEVRHQDDDFVTIYDSRDAATNEGYAQVALRTGERLTLRADALVGRARTTSRKYGHSDQLVGAGASADLGAWRLDAGVWSGLSRYRDALPGDSNHRRRDQWIQIRAGTRRPIARGFALLAGGEYTDQNSSRFDRSHTRTTFQLGLTWAAAGE